MEKQYICYQDKSGKPAYREASAEELAAMQPPAITWHKPAKAVRVCFTAEQYAANLQRLLEYNMGLKEHPFLASLAADAATGTFLRVDADGMVYYYCESVDEVDEAIVINYGGYVEPKPIL